MKNFILITNSFKDKNLELSNQITQFILQKGGKSKCLVTNTHGNQNEEFKISDIPSDVECILVLGGDGTLIRAATKVESLQIPLIGVNLGTLGYLCELEATTVFSAIERLMEDDFVIEERMMLTGHEARKEDAKIALNDIVIHRAGNLSILCLRVYVNGELLSTYNADGIIIATPTGSTGYNMSVGGPIVEPKAKMLLLTPINAHNLNSKSIVLAADDVVEIEIGKRRAENDEQAAVIFDGDQIMQIGVGDRIVVSQATHITRVCKLSKMSFLENLRRKMENYT